MRFIILDRDGVINEDSDDFIKSPSEWKPIRGSLEAIARLHRAGWRVIVATNQSGIARQLFDLDTLARIHHTMQQRVNASGGLIDHRLLGSTARHEAGVGDCLLDADSLRHRSILRQ